MHVIQALPRNRHASPSFANIRHRSLFLAFAGPNSVGPTPITRCLSIFVSELPSGLFPFGIHVVATRIVWLLFITATTSASSKVSPLVWRFHGPVERYFFGPKLFPEILLSKTVVSCSSAFVFVQYASLAPYYCLLAIECTIITLYAIWFSLFGETNLGL